MTFNVKFDTPPMKEDFLHYLFKTKQLGKEFVSTENQSIKIKSFGIHNFNAGPDFLNAQVEYDNMTWAGHIEFHVKSSDWYAHKHQTDPAYENVIVHMVYEDDKEVLINGQPIPTIEIKNLVNLNQYSGYLKLQNQSKIPCSHSLGNINDISVLVQKEKALVNRLERKSNKILDLLVANKGDNKKVLLLLLAEVFGGKVNAEPMVRLFSDFNLNWIQKLNAETLELEALLLGKGGFLEDPDDDYSKNMKSKAAHTIHMLQLDSLKKVNWKYSRMRPANFPEFKLMQLAALISTPNYYKLLISNKLDYQLVEPSDYWQEHYRIGKPSKLKSTKISSGLYDLIRINAVVPYLFAMGIYKKDQNLKDQALEILNSIKPEMNSITKEWKSAEIKIQSAFDSQALIEQKNEWCLAKKCLFCNIGNEVLKN